MPAGAAHRLRFETCKNENKRAYFKKVFTDPTFNIKMMQMKWAGFKKYTSLSLYRSDLDSPVDLTGFSDSDDASWFLLRRHGSGTDQWFFFLVQSMLSARN